MMLFSHLRKESTDGQWFVDWKSVNYRFKQPQTKKKCMVGVQNFRFFIRTELLELITHKKRNFGWNYIKFRYSNDYYLSTSVRIEKYDIAGIRQPCFLQYHLTMSNLLRPGKLKLTLPVLNHLSLRVLGRVNYFSLYNSMYFKAKNNSPDPVPLI